MTNSVDESSKKRILVVDDEDPVRWIICEMLSSAGYEHLDFGSGREALEELKSGSRFQLLLTGLMMPEMDGIALMEHVRRDYPDLPIMMVTAVHDAQVMEVAFREGAVGYLLKPFNHEHLIGAVEEVLAPEENASKPQQVPEELAVETSHTPIRRPNPIFFRPGEYPKR